MSFDNFMWLLLASLFVLPFGKTVYVPILFSFWGTVFLIGVWDFFIWVIK